AWSACSSRAIPHRGRRVTPASPAGEGARARGDMLAGHASGHRADVSRYGALQPLAGLARRDVSASSPWQLVDACVAGGGARPAEGLVSGCARVFGLPVNGFTPGGRLSYGAGRGVLVAGDALESPVWRESS